MHVFS
jgi:hypothetical protein